MNNNKALIESIKLLSKTLGKHEIAKRLGMSRHQLYRFCKKHNVKLSDVQLPKSNDSSSKETVKSIKNLAVTLTDRAIGERLGLTKSQVYKIRKKNKIYRDSTTNNISDTPSVKSDIFVPTKNTLIFTSWESRVRPDVKFIQILKNIAKDQDGELICSVVWPDDELFIPPILKNNFNIVNKDFPITKYLDFVYIPTHALATIPTSNYKSFSNKSVIIPALLKDSQTLPSIGLPKLVSSTGSVGRLNAFSTDYNFIENELHQRKFVKRWSQITNRRGGSVFVTAKNYIEPTALIVKIDSSGFFSCRYITMKNDYVHDLNKTYYPDGRIEHNIPEALVIGDLHAYNLDKKEYSETLEMIKFFQPKNVYIQDVFDGCSLNPHEINSSAKRFEFPSIEEEAEITKKVLSQICNVSKNVKYIQSNHDRFLLDFLDKETNWNLNKSYVLALELQLFRMKEKRHPIIKLLDLDNFSNLEFISETERHFLKNTLIRHGHETISGKRAGFYEQAKLYGSFIMGHIHSWKQWRDAVQVGKLIRSNIEYAAGGAGSWIAAHCLVHEDDSKQGLFIIDGKWVI